MPLQPVQRSSVADAVFDQLLDEVLSGQIDAGDPLPAERALTAALGVNRQAVREALQRLAEAGLVEIRHGGRTLVRDFRASAGLDLLPRLLVRPDGTVDADVANALMELRAGLGPDVARRCAERADAATGSRIADLTARMADAGEDLGVIAALDLQFWDAIVEGADNIAYRFAFNGMRRTYEPIAELLRQTLSPELLDHAGRGVIAAAITAGDGAAAAAGAARLLARGEAAVQQLMAALDQNKERT